MTAIGEAPAALVPPGQQVGGVLLDPVDECATELHLRVAKTFDHVDAALDRYRLYTYWRSVFEAAATQLTAQANYALADVQDESGLSSQKIANLLAEAGYPMSKSGVEAAIKKGRTARADDEMGMEP